MLAAVKLTCSNIPVHSLVVEAFLLGLVFTPHLPISGTYRLFLYRCLLSDRGYSLSSKVDKRLFDFLACVQHALCLILQGIIDDFNSVTHSILGNTVLGNPFKNSLDFTSLYDGRFTYMLLDKVCLVDSFLILTVSLWLSVWMAPACVRSLGMRQCRIGFKCFANCAKYQN